VGISVPASGTSDQVLPWVTGGLVSVCLTPGDTTGKLNFFLAGFNDAGAFSFRVAEWKGITVAVAQLAQAADTITGIHVVNTDAAAAHTYDAQLVAAP
jgi:hypothetical protein